MIKTPHDPGATDPPEGLDADDAIPMLTEIIELPALGPATLAGPAAPAEIDWNAIEQRVRDDVAERLARRVDTVFVQRLDAAMQGALERATRQFSVELRAALTEATQDLVARAVAEEITRAQLDLAQRDGEI